MILFERIMSFMNLTKQQMYSLGLFGYCFLKQFLKMIFENIMGSLETIIILLI